MGRVSNATYRDCAGVTNRALVQYLENALRHKGVAVRPDWCSPVRWRMFGVWYKQFKNRERLSKLYYRWR